MIAHSQLVLFGQLVHTQDGNDILERLVILENFLDSSGNIIVLLANLEGQLGQGEDEGEK